MLAQLEPVVPAARARLCLLDLHLHERRHAGLLCAEGEGFELNESGKAVIDDAARLLVPGARVVHPKQVVVGWLGEAGGAKHKKARHCVE